VESGASLVRQKCALRIWSSRVQVWSGKIMLSGFGQVGCKSGQENMCSQDLVKLGAGAFVQHLAQGVRAYKDKRTGALGGA